MKALETIMQSTCNEFEKAEAICFIFTERFSLTSDQNEDIMYHKRLCDLFVESNEKDSEDAFKIRRMVKEVDCLILAKNSFLKNV